MKSNFQLTLTIQQLRKFEGKLENDNQTILGIFFIKLWNWNIEHFFPIVYVTTTDLYLYINESYTKIDLNKKTKIGIENGKDEKFPTKFSIDFEKEKIEFSLVSIDNELQKINNKYTTDFHKLIQNIIDGKIIEKTLLERLPNQISSGYVSMKSIPLIVSALLMFAFGIMIQPFNFTLAWFLLIGGMVVGVMGLVVAVFKRQLK
jgi:hypothetical protein